MSNLWNKRIPTLLGLTLVLLGVVATSYLTYIGVSPFSHASAGENPQGIRITNITDTSFTVTYTTNDSVIGSLSVGINTNFGQVALDDRDQPTGIPMQYLLHSITVRNLQPLTTYYFAINSGKTTYLNQNTPFTVTTGPRLIATPPSEVPLAGDVKLPTGDNPPEALVYVSTANGQTLSTLTKPNGIYIIPLNSMRIPPLTAYTSFTNETTLQILVVGETDLSRATLLATQRNPVPTITLANNYDFTVNTVPIASTSATFLGFPAFSLNTTIVAQPQIETPSQNQQFSDQQPLLRGKGLPNQTVKIVIHSQNVLSTTVTTDKYGNWTYRPTTPLPPGQHTISVITSNQNGILQTIQQTFTIFASGTQVAEAATPSATPTVIITPTATPTSTPTPMPSPTLSPTATPASVSPTATPSPTPTVTGKPTPKPTIAPTGNNTLITSGIATLVTTAAGIVLFLFSRGSSL